MNTFRQIAPTDHFGWHAAYLPVYDRLFRTVGHGSVAELGCDGGGGILTYADFFSRIAGVMLPREFISCDIAPRPPSLDANKQIIHYQSDAYSIGFVNDVMKKHAPYAVMVEDGPHTLGSQMFFVEHYTPLISNNGIGIVEDVQSLDHIPQLYGKLPAGFMGYAVDLRWADDRYDSLLFVIERR